MIFLSTLSLINFLFLYNLDTTYTYYSLTTRFWEIGIGVIAYLLTSTKFVIKEIYQKLLLIILIFSLLIIFFIPLSFGRILTIKAVLITSLFLFVVDRENNQFGIFKNKIFIKLGIASYSLYIWHWPILSISKWTIGINLYTLPFQIILILFISYLSHNYIEIPVRKRLKTHSHDLLFLLTSFLSLIGIVIASNYKGANNLFIGKRRKPQIYLYKNWLVEDCGSSRSGQNLKFNFSKCEFEGNKNFDQLNKKLFIYGDSYVKNIIPNFIDNTKNFKFSKYSGFYSNGCLPSKAISYTTEKKIGYCSELFKKYLNYFNKRSDENDYLMIVMNYNFFSQKLFGNHKLFTNREKKLSNQEAFDLFQKEILSLSNELSTNKKHLIVVSPIPILNMDPQKCNQFFSKQNKDCLRILDVKNRELIKINEKMAAFSKNKFTYLDTYQSINKMIYQYQDELGKIYQNKDHLTPFGASLLSDQLKSKL